MDTYFTVDYKCIKCGRCVEACELNWLIISQFMLHGETKRIIRGIDNEPPCDMCQEKPCIEVCRKQAITIESI